MTAVYPPVIMVETSGISAAARSQTKMAATGGQAVAADEVAVVV
ncbi:hypothetical protein [Mycolicibacterium pulveris]|nr:hypothetical protein [Mycolicibacterium pulveris]